MGKKSVKPEPNLPWVESRADSHFRLLTIFLLILFFFMGAMLNSMTLPEVKQKKLIDVSPRLAKLIQEKKKLKPPPPPPPPPPKKEIPKEKEPEKQVPVKEPVKKKPKPSAAREVAKKSGLIALSDELADLRESLDLDSIIEMPMVTGGQQETGGADSSTILSAQAKQSSGGIAANTLSRKITTSELATRKTTEVSSAIQAAVNTSKTGAGGKSKTTKVPTRSADEVERVFQKNKGSIFSIYNRALRKNPSLEGKVLVELVIEPNGIVSSVKIISSELGDTKLERKLVLKIKKFKFSNRKVPQITVTYPLDFLPA